MSNGSCFPLPPRVASLLGVEMWDWLGCVMCHWGVCLAHIMPSVAGMALLDDSICLHAFGCARCGLFGGVEPSERRGV